MATTNIRDILTSFSPSLDFFAISSGDGRIKIWDTLKGQIQTELADIVSTEETSLYSKQIRGHLSVDYKCMKWLSLDRKKKRKLGSSLLVLGTGSGDVLALDVSAGQLKWRVSDCHPGGVGAISCAVNGSCIYTAGVDGMTCKIDSRTGNMLEKFKASTKAISCMCVSSDGKLLATAAGQLKVFSLSENKKKQKFSGHPGAVRCLVFTEDDKYILTSAVGDRHIAVWRLDGSKKKSVSCVLAMDHPAIFLDSKWVDNEAGDGGGLYVLAVSEVGVCYFWYGHNIEDLRNSKPTKVMVSTEDISKNHKRALPAIIGARLQGICKPASGNVFVAYGLLVKPSFQKISVHCGTDIKLNILQDGVLLPLSQSLSKSKKGLDIQTAAITALDRANAEDALIPVPKISNLHERKKQSLALDANKVMADLVNSRSPSKLMENSDELDQVKGQSEVSSLEDHLRSLGILSPKDDLASDSILDSTLKGIDLRANLPEKKMRAAILSKSPSDAYKLLGVLVATWKSRPNFGKNVLPWINSILVNHTQYVLSQEPMNQILDSIYKIAKTKGGAIQHLLQLSGRLRLVMTQINKANKSEILMPDCQIDESEEEDEDEDGDILYGEEDDESQISSDDDE